MYDYDLTPSNDGKQVRAEVFNTHSGITMVERTFKGPFRYLRAKVWAHGIWQEVRATYRATRPDTGLV